MTPSFTLAANRIDIARRRIDPVEVRVEHGRIRAIRAVAGPCDFYVCPGFIDAHVHIESSLMTPGEFARRAVVHGTVATVSDPHEIANVTGLAGVRAMLADGRASPLKFHFGAPSCVPATAFETAGAELTVEDVRDLFETDGLGYLSEMMNWPGVLLGDAGVWAKLDLAKSLGKPIDGHAPGLTGTDALRYAAAGITTDHECVGLHEAEEKLAAGMTIAVREGSAARNFDVLHPLIATHPGRVMFCTDDLHPDALDRGHVDRLVARAVEYGHDLFAVLEAACVTPACHYNLPVGRLRAGDPADFVVLEDLHSFRPRATYIDGVCVAAEGRSRLRPEPGPAPNRFHAGRFTADDFRLPAPGGGSVRVIETIDGSLITRELHLPPAERDGAIVADVTRDVLKVAAVNRYRAAAPAVALVRGFGLRRGAIAGSVAHDSHNVIAVGAHDADLCAAIMAVIDARGGLAVADGGRLELLPLEVAGLMTRDGAAAAEGYARLDAAAHDLGSPLRAPFMTLSFLALLVIPALKLSDRGLFDGREFRFVSLVV